jgi:hypothetical protein
MGEEAPPTPPATSLYVDGCPGCAIERRKESSKAIPYKELFFVAITTIASGTTNIVLASCLELLCG